MLSYGLATFVSAFWLGMFAYWLSETFSKAIISKSQKGSLCKISLISDGIERYADSETDAEDVRGTFNAPLDSEEDRRRLSLFLPLGGNKRGPF